MQPSSQEDSLGDVGPGPGVGHEGDDHGGDQPAPQVHIHWRGGDRQGQRGAVLG